MKGCNLCNHTKTFPAGGVRMLMPNHIHDSCWQVILVDLITELPQSHRYDTIMVVVNCLSKHTHITLKTLDIIASRVAQLF